MKKIFYASSIALFFLLSSPAINAQSFTFIPDNISKTDTLLSEIIFKIPIKNISSSPINIAVVRRSNELPFGWASSLCFDVNCFAPFIDSIASTIEYGSEQIAVGDSLDFSIHVFPMIMTGISRVKVTAKNMANLSDSITVLVTASATVVSVELENIYTSSFLLEQNYPNPISATGSDFTTISFSIPEAGTTSLSVFNPEGKEVTSSFNCFLPAGKHFVKINTGHLAAGVYFYKLTSSKYSASKKMIVVK